MAVMFRSCSLLSYAAIITGVTGVSMHRCDLSVQVLKRKRRRDPMIRRPFS
jgi:hypothetical protein